MTCPVGSPGCFALGYGSFRRGIFGLCELCDGSEFLDDRSDILDNAP
jgi:hypothetical protein